MAESNGGECPKQQGYGNTGTLDLDALATAAMWFAGFNTFQPLNICRGGSSFLLKRFGFPVEKTGTFVGETNASVNYFVFWGTLCALLLSTLTRMIEAEWAKFITPVLSIISNVVVVIINLQIFRVYRSFSGCKGVRNFYFWMSLAGLAYSFGLTVTRNVSPDKSVDRSFGENFANGFVSLLHWTIRSSLKLFRIPEEEHNYYLMFWHIMFVVGLSIFTLILWLFHLSTNVFTVGTSRSELADALKWLLKLDNSKRSSSQEEDPPSEKRSWDKYLGNYAEKQQSNFETYFGKLKRLNTKLKDACFTEDVSESFSEIDPKLDKSRYQLRNYLEKVADNVEKLNTAIAGISISNVSVNITVQNGDINQCSGIGTLSINNRSKFTMKEFKCTINGAEIALNGPLANETINLKSLCNSTMVVKNTDDAKILNITLSRVSGAVSSNTKKELEITILEGSTPDDTSSFGEVKTIEIKNLQGTKALCAETALVVDIKLEFKPELSKKQDNNSNGNITFELNNGSTGGNTSTSATLTSSCITVKGMLKKECQRCQDSSKAVRVRFTDLSNGLYTRVLSLSTASVAQSDGVQSVDCKLALTSKPSSGTLTLSVPKVIISNCKINANSESTTSVTVKKIELVDLDQRAHYEKLIRVLKDQFPGKSETIDKKLKADGVTEQISGAFCNNGGRTNMKTITITTGKNNVCLYTVMELQETLGGVTGKQSGFMNIKKFIDTKTNEVEIGYNASLKRGASPATMIITGTIILFFIYPSVSPYLMVAERHTYFTSLILLFISSIGPFIPWILGHKYLRKHTGFNQYWIGKGRDYHFLWILFPIATIIFFMFLIILHYPTAWLSKHIRYRWPAIIFCSTYHFCLYILRPIGSGGTYPNAAGVMVEDKLENPKEIFSYDADYENGKATMTMVVSIRFAIMVVSILVGQSYASSYRSYTTGDQSNLPWPTASMNAMASCYWWSRLALKKANHRFWHIRDTDIAALIT